MRKQFIALLYGWIFVLLFILVMSFVLALVLQFTDISRQMLSWMTFSAGFLGLFIGGALTGMKGKSKGWLFGGLTGAGFTLFIFLVQYLGYQNGFSTEQLFQHAGYFAAAVAGGILGVNLFRTAEK